MLLKCYDHGYLIERVRLLSERDKVTHSGLLSIFCALNLFSSTFFLFLLFLPPPPPLSSSSSSSVIWLLRVCYSWFLLFTRWEFELQTTPIIVDLPAQSTTKSTSKSTGTGWDVRSKRETHKPMQRIIITMIITPWIINGRRLPPSWGTENDAITGR